MDNRYEELTELINKIAAKNPYITKDKISKAKAMYLGDQRPLSDIEAELEEYSAEIYEQNTNSQMERMPRDVPKDYSQQVEPTATKESVILQQEVTTPPIDGSYIMGENPNNHQDELYSMFEESNKNATLQADESLEFGQEKPKQFVKTSKVKSPTQTLSGGFGSLLTISCLFSIMTIIISLVVLFIN